MHAAQPWRAASRRNGTVWGYRPHEFRSGYDVFCGDPGSPGYAACAAQTQLFALASAVPALLGLALLAAAFAAPGIRDDSALRTRVLSYSLVAWGIAAGTYVMGGLPSF